MQTAERPDCAGREAADAMEKIGALIIDNSLVRPKIVEDLYFPAQVKEHVVPVLGKKS